MDTVTLVNGFLEELGHQSGIEDLRLDDHRLCSLQYRDDVEIVIELPEQSPTVYFYAPMMPVPQQERETLFTRLLKLNFLCLETRGATLAIDEKNSRIILCYGHPVELLDFLAFENLTGNFAETARTLKTELNTPMDDTSSKASDERPDWRPFDAGTLRV